MSEENGSNESKYDNRIASAVAALAVAQVAEWIIAENRERMFDAAYHAALARFGKMKLAAMLSSPKAQASLALEPAKTAACHAMLAAMLAGQDLTLMEVRDHITRTVEQLGGAQAVDSFIENDYCAIRGVGPITPETYDTHRNDMMFAAALAVLGVMYIDDRRRQDQEAQG